MQSLDLQMPGDGPTQGDAITGTGNHHILPTLLHDAKLGANAHAQAHQAVDQRAVAINPHHTAGLPRRTVTEQAQIGHDRRQSFSA